MTCSLPPFMEPIKGGNRWRVERLARIWDIFWWRPHHASGDYTAMSATPHPGSVRTAERGCWSRFKLKGCQRMLLSPALTILLWPSWWKVPSSRPSSERSQAACLAILLPLVGLTANGVLQRTQRFSRSSVTCTSITWCLNLILLL